MSSAIFLAIISSRLYIARSLIDKRIRNCSFGNVCVLSFMLFIMHNKTPYFGLEGKQASGILVQSHPNSVSSAFRPQICVFEFSPQLKQFPNEHNAEVFMNRWQRISLQEDEYFTVELTGQNVQHCPHLLGVYFVYR